MAWTKRQLIDAAYGELAMAGYAFDRAPEEDQAALVKLDAMMASADIDIGYAFGLSQDDTDLDQDSGLQLVDTEAVYMGLAVRLAASKGKTLQRSTITAARAAWDGLLSRDAHRQVKQQQLRAGVPRGAGSKNLEHPFTPQPDTSPLQGSEDELQFLGN